ncbi:MAG: isovaleryl-CoA dehydrogenase [Phenylobacterium sp.]|jgi:putative acyl-CoA dehydrogenase|uniref:isovaleryl-CoA dehydrogenase n=1 Tax=Phenylobacterium sp. TaxID=1871053 RepID=UPI002A35D7D8|nr:isovaleryl-CoA dehydrogenase [Phenylobacterium sp.]MDX9997890.1 isovaleryl-CoA dehydrogenase [Phenylobacterium sp.]
MDDALSHLADEPLNQPPPLEPYNLFNSDRALVEAVEREGAAWAVDDLAAYGARLGSPETARLGYLANRDTPRLHTHDRQGRRIDWVEFHPAWHELMALLVGQGLHASPWSDPKPGAQVHRAAGLYMTGQVEAGTSCPISMTYAAIPVLRRAAPEIQAWLPRLYSRTYDPAHRPAAEKAGALVGMGMTEKQGGSDVRSNQTRATPLGEAGPGRPYLIDGHKWFMSAPMCDAFLVLAQAPGGLSCFFLPRWMPEGTLNGVRFQRLKDKLGNRSNASSEVEFHGAFGWLVGEEGRGVPTIIEMANHTRLDNVVASAGVQRQALAQAIHHARHRTAFQRRLVDQPLMAAVLADMALEVEAATALAFRLARTFDAETDPAESRLRRLLTPAAKYWVCKRGPVLAAEALEVLGGNGYVEDSGLPRLYRELPVYSIWEGSANVMCLDVLRALRREPDALDALAAELAPARGADAALDARIEAVLDAAREGPGEAALRRWVRDLVVTLQAALLARSAPGFVAEGFIAGRLSGDPGAFGALPDGIAMREIVERAAPAGT